MALWRCPHCGTPQPVAARCWVCKRSATSCGTCRHFRASVATRIGYCGLDRDRAPLAGDEIRGCWVAVPAIATGIETATAADQLVEFAPPRLILGFVPVESVAGAAAAAGETATVTVAVAPLPPTLVPSPAPADEGMLWSDLEA
jgi:hypothetical protein